MNTARKTALLLAAASLAAAGQLPTATAQLTPPTASPSNPIPSNPGTEDLLVVAPSTAAARTLPGLLGSFGLDPASSTVLPIGDRATLPINTSNRTVYWQFIERDPGSAGGALSPVFLAEPGQRLGSPARRAPADVVATAREFVDSVAGGELAPDWTGARVSERAVPFLRPDLNGPAYWEFAVEPAGFVLVAAGEHDFRIAHWSASAEPRTRLLLDSAAQAGHQSTAFYKLDTLAYASEDAAGRRAGRLGNQPPRLVPAAGGSYTFAAWDSWHQLKADYATVYAAQIADLRQQCAGQWRATRLGGAGLEASYSSWYVRWAGSTADQRNYNQWLENGSYIGCGPVAWMMLFGWGDYRAHQGDANWSSRTGLYRSGGYRNGSSSAVAPSYNDSGVRRAIREIHDLVRTFAIGSSGATYPWDMGRASGYLSGRTGATLRTGYHAAGLHTTSLRDTARSSITSRRTPCILGTGWLNHYPLAWGYKSRSRTDFFGTTYERFFYVNQGWGGSGNTWIQAGTWFAGELRR